MKNQYNAAFTLIELLIAISISFIVLGTTIMYLVFYQKNNHDLHQQQVNANILTISNYVFNNELSSAAYTFCANTNNIINNGVDDTDILTSNNAIQIFHANANNVPNFVSKQHDSESDIIVWRKAGSLLSHLNQNVNIGDNTLSVNKIINYNENNNILLSDCQNSELLKVSQVKNHTNDIVLITTKALKNNYDQQHSMIAKWQFAAFYIADNNKDGSLYPKSLYYDRDNSKAQEVVNGIKKLTASKQKHKLIIHLTLYNNQTIPIIINLWNV